MASIGAGNTGKSKRKSLEAELNLVPFIDLLSTCICFLLITAVWIQIGSIQIKQLVGTESAATKPNSLELDVRFASGNKIDVAIRGQTPTKIPPKFTVEGTDAQALVTQLQNLMNGFGPLLHLDPKLGDVKTQLNQLFTAARVTTKTGVPYGELVSVLDVIRDHGIVNLGVIPVKE
jgi:biopolymer transport protein TolR